MTHREKGVNPIYSFKEETKMSVNTDYSRYSVSSTKTADTGKTAAKTTKAASEDVKTDTSAKRTDTFERS